MTLERRLRPALRDGSTQRPAPGRKGPGFPMLRHGSVEFG